MASALPLGLLVQAAPSAAPATLTFTKLPHGLDGNFAVAEGYKHQVLIRWSDPVFAGAPAFDPARPTQQSQLSQFGFNNDFIGFVPLPPASDNSVYGLLVVNHEYTDPEMMFPGSPKATELDLAQTDVDIAAHGLSVIEVHRQGEQWQGVGPPHHARDANGADRSGRWKRTVENPALRRRRVHPPHLGQLRRRRHSLGCNLLVNDDGRVVAYRGDDKGFEYIYRFVSSGTYRPDDRAANLRLLDEGSLSVARFNDDGSLLWLPLLFGQGSLTPANGFHGADTFRWELLLLAGNPASDTTLYHPDISANGQKPPSPVAGASSPVLTSLAMSAASVVCSDSQASINTAIRFMGFLGNVVWYNQYTTSDVIKP